MEALNINYINLHPPILFHISCTINQAVSRHRYLVCKVLGVLINIMKLVLIVTFTRVHQGKYHSPSPDDSRALMNKHWKGKI